MLGTHLLLDLFDCPVELLRTPAECEHVLLRAATAMQATVISHDFHAFQPHGVSGVVVIAESHLSIHTWPERNFAALDIFSCGNLDLEAGVAILLKEFRPGRVVRRTFERG